MKILLIKPKWFVHGGVYRFLEDVKFTPLHIAVIAALSEGHEVRLCDNDWEEIPWGEHFDLVGITTATFTSERAYELADRWRERGARVVLGGVHASLLPEECLEHAEAVVVGEAEYIWSSVLRDVETGTLKGIYQQERPTDMNDVPVPRRDLFREKYWVATVQTSRGCPNHCKFCYLPSVPWHRHRIRDIDLVYEELRTLKQKVIFFVDDNMFADEDYVIRLCHRIAPLKKLWSVQAPTNIARNDRLLSAMADAGCFHVQLGFQTVNPGSLRSAGIDQNRIEDYTRVVKAFHRYNILVLGFFMFGFDHDHSSIFDSTEKVIKQIDLDDVCLYILTPYPGTEMYDTFKRQGRLLDNARLDYGWSNAVFQPALMSPTDLEQGVQAMYERLYNHFKNTAGLKIIRRLPILLRQPRLMSLIVKALFRRVDISRKPI
ncbi:radical SAM protein [bacterium]|nr:radical SAM protein [bacterium]